MPYYYQLWCNETSEARQLKGDQFCAVVKRTDAHFLIVCLFFYTIQEMICFCSLSICLNLVKTY